MPRSWYYLEGDRPGWEAVRLEQVGERWEVTFDDRGERVVLGSFDTEDEACQFLAARMLKTLSESVRSTRATPPPSRAWRIA